MLSCYSQSRLTAICVHRRVHSHDKLNNPSVHDCMKSFCFSSSPDIILIFSTLSHYSGHARRRGYSPPIYACFTLRSFVICSCTFTRATPYEKAHHHHLNSNASLPECTWLLKETKDNPLIGLVLVTPETQR